MVVFYKCNTSTQQLNIDKHQHKYGDTLRHCCCCTGALSRFQNQRRPLRSVLKRNTLRKSACNSTRDFKISNLENSFTIIWAAGRERWRSRTKGDEIAIATRWRVGVHALYRAAYDTRKTLRSGLHHTILAYGCDGHIWIRQDSRNVVSICGWRISGEVVVATTTNTKVYWIYQSTGPTHLLRELHVSLVCGDRTTRWWVITWAYDVAMECCFYPSLFAFSLSLSLFSSSFGGY